MVFRKTLVAVAIVASALSIATVPAAAFQSIGNWQVTTTSDGRLFAQVEANEDPASMETGEFSTLALVCGRDGHLKLSLQTHGGESYPAVVFEPDYNGGVTYRMSRNEILGDPAMDFLGQLVWAERQLLPQGRRMFGNFVSANSDAGYISTFDMTGLEQLLAHMLAGCGS